MSEDNGVSLWSAEHPYVISGWDQYGNAISETIELQPSRPLHPVKSFLMRHTPWWAWNFVWYQWGFTKMRMITRIRTINEDSLVEEEIEIDDA